MRSKISGSSFFPKAHKLLRHYFLKGLGHVFTVYKHMVSLCCLVTRGVAIKGETDSPAQPFAAVITNERLSRPSQMSSGGDPYYGEEIVTTIYVNGFPEDFREREFQNLFAFAKGYEGCSLRIPTADSEASGSPLLRCFSSVPRGQILGFAKFRTLQDALDACRMLNGRVVDAERGSVLRVEMAKKNLVLSQIKSKAAPPPLFEASSKEHYSLFGGPAAVIARRSSVPVTTTVYQGGSKCVGGGEVASVAPVQPQQQQRSLSLSIPGNPLPVPIAAPNVPSRECSLSTPGSIMSMATVSGGPSGAMLPAKSSSVPTSIASTPAASLLCAIGSNSMPAPENPPCNTLYVGNLPPNASEMELRAIFCIVQGFRRLSFKPKLGGSPMCFVEFEDVPAATTAMETLHGTLLSNSTKGGIRLSYSKNPLGVRPGPPMSTILGSSLYADLFAPLPDFTMRDLIHPELGPAFNRMMESPVAAPGAAAQ